MDFFKDSCEITELKKCDGEASANNRKAKLIFFYEWELKADWKGRNFNSVEAILFIVYAGYFYFSSRWKYLDCYYTHAKYTADIFTAFFLYISGVSKQSEETFEGSLEIPNLSEENEAHEIEVRE